MAEKDDGGTVGRNLLDERLAGRRRRRGGALSGRERKVGQDRLSWRDSAAAAPTVEGEN